MNYLQLCQAVRSRIGMHGTGPSTVVSPTDVEKDIVDAVYDAWIDIQNYRTEWDWMKASTSFSTAIGKTNYKKSDVDGPSNRISRFVPVTLRIYKDSKWTWLGFLDDEDAFEYLHINDTLSQAPYEYTHKRADGSIEMNKPDAVYSMTVSYWKTPQLLTANTDTPEMPEQWHLLIVYLAIQKLSASIASASTQFEAGQAYAVMMGQMMREQLKKKRMTAKGIA